MENKQESSVKAKKKIQLDNPKAPEAKTVAEEPASAPEKDSKAKSYEPNIQALVEQKLQQLESEPGVTAPQPAVQKGPTHQVEDLIEKV